MLHGTLSEAAIRRNRVRLTVQRLKGGHLSVFDSDICSTYDTSYVGALFKFRTYAIIVKLMISGHIR